MNQYTLGFSHLPDFKTFLGFWNYLRNVILGLTLLLKAQRAAEQIIGITTTQVTC